MKYDSSGNPKGHRTFTVLTVILVVVVGLVSSFLTNDQEDSGPLRFNSKGFLSIQDVSGAVFDVYYTDMVEVTYMETPDFGTENGGSVLNNVRLGQWHSSQFGSYINCTDTEVPSCLWIQTKEQNYAVNYESDETTQSLHKAILKARIALNEQEE